MNSINEISYLLDAKVQISDWSNTSSFDLFISAYNQSERVQHVYKNISSEMKFWWALPEYNYSPNDLPADQICIEGFTGDEADLVKSAFNKSLLTKDVKLCIDITGFMRHHILALLRYLKENEITEFHMIYSEPERYLRGAETNFSLEDIETVRQVSGFGGNSDPETKKDLLILGASYDHNLMGQVIRQKEGARLIQLMSLPSLSADMYQESLIRIDKVETSVGDHQEETDQFCSANDPFLIAASLSRLVTSQIKNIGITNMYLSPLATKPQTLGFGLYYLKECAGKAASIILPFPKKYNRETSEGIGRIWLYPIYL